MTDNQHNSLSDSGVQCFTITGSANQSEFAVVNHSHMLDQVDFICDDGDIDDLDIDNGEGYSDSNESQFYDTVIGHIEDIIVGDEFQELQNAFYKEHADIFTDDEENKFEYTDIHNQYVNILEKHIEDQLALRMEDFSMEEFSRQLLERKDHQEGEVFEVLATFFDFSAFKEAMLDFKKDLSGDALDVSFDFTITPLTPRSGGLLLGPAEDEVMVSPSSSLNVT